MKTLKALSISFAAAAALAGTASAQTVIHVAGSTAFRAPATAAMIDYLNANSSGRGVYAGYTGSSLLGAGNAILANGTIGAGGTATIEIETYWTGSLAGLVDLVTKNTVGTQYLDPSVIGTTAIAAINNSGTPNVTVGTATNSSVYGGGVVITPSAVANSFPDLTFSDSHKATVQTELATATLSAPIGTFTTIGQIASTVGGGTVVDSGSSTDAGNDVGATALSDGLVGVLGFQWAASKGAPAITNISQQAVKTLMNSGNIDASLLTGVSGSGVTFYLTGRNEDSGTRIDTFSEAQYGVTSAPKQYQSNFTLFPANSTLNTEANISWAPAGHSGFASGSNVATAVDSTTSGGTKYLIGALGITDALTAQTGGATLLSYNGVPYSVANIQNGLYTLWAYEHAYHLSSLTGAVLTAANAIADNVHDTDADIAGNGKHSAVSGDVAAGILYDGNFNVFRPVTPEGGPITHF